ncbi:uncharacterized protein [Epargyreus clarus]|uniref:uncharacterized protein n=1 Tax=Epargyreus clarus TaxID=520877 RepID=UPI003C2DA7C6
MAPVVKIYNCRHSTIDIYTTDGRKINGPLELINGAAYVAVEPPDTFVDTGYEEYLLKASRSWDKRLVQKSYNSDTKDPKLNLSADDTIKSGENASPKVGDNATSSMKNQSAKSRQIPQRKPVTCAKPIQKKKPSDPHNATLKRICAETDKIFPCPRKTSLRNEVSNRKRSLVPCSRNVSQEQSMCSKNASQCATRREKSQDSEYHGTPSDIKTSNVVGNLPYSLLSCNDSLEVQKKTQKKRILSDTIPDEVQTVVSLYHNKDRDVTSITSNAESDQTTDISVNQQNDKRNYDLKDLNTENNGAIQQDAVVQETEQINNKGINDLTVDEIKTETQHDNEPNAFPVNNEILKDEKEKNTPSKIPPIENVRENKLENEDTTSNNHISDKQATDEYIAYMNRGGLLLLKFNIKVKDCKTIFNRDKSNDTQLTTSLINLLKTEKISQVNIDVNFSSELLKSNNGRCVEDKSLQSVINKLYSEDTDHIDSKQPRIIIIKCACRDYLKGEKERDSTICGCSDEEETYRTRPKEKLNGMVPW